MRSSIARAGWCGALAAVASCGGGGDKPPAGPDPNVVTAVVVEPSTGTLNALGATLTLAAQARNASGASVAGRTYTWASSANNVATVSASGEVTAVSNGSATITATLTGGTLAGSAAVTVQQQVATLAIQPQNNALIVGQSQQLSTTAADARGGAVSGALVAWSSSATAVATVSPASGLVTGVAPGTATITATVGTVTATTTVRVSLPSLTLVRDTTLSGTRTYNTITIPAGVTVTAGGPLTMTATGNVNVAGTLTSTCQPIELRGDTAVTVTGTVFNGCAQGTAGANLRIAATGELTLTGATITSSGDITLTNDPTLSDSSFTSLGMMARSPLANLTRLPGGIPFTRVRNSTVRFHGGGTGPFPAKDGANGVTGGDGENGRPVKFFLAGTAVFENGNLLWGQDGGRGGNGDDDRNVDVTARGGNGGHGGLIRIRVTGKLTYEGVGNIVRAGRGGAGGRAIATARTNASNPGRAPSATATGGAGGDAGLVDMRAGQGIEILPAGQLIVELGAGAGGDATATGATGVDALTLPNTPAQIGGNATARGGKGGNTPDVRAVQNLTGGPPVFRAQGGGPVNGGLGGAATAVAGNGGKGVKPFKDGAAGGNISATGGTGGDGKLRDAANAPLGAGGNGGNAALQAGNGGAGWNDCVAPDFEPGGKGGDGGNTSGARGLKGSGPPDGTDGTVRYENVANGGRGGNGAGPGLGGRKGTRGVVPEGTPVIVNPAFADGAPGTDCTPPPPPPPPQTSYDLDTQLPVSSGVVPSGTYTARVLLNGTQVGTMPVSTFGSPVFTAQNPTREGWGASSGWIDHVGSIMVNGQPLRPTVYSYCLLNAFPSTSLPILVEQLNAAGQVIKTRTVTSLALVAPASGNASALAEQCFEDDVDVQTDRIRTRGGPGGDRRSRKAKR